MQQPNGSDWGVFAHVFATSIVLGEAEDRCELIYHNSNHLVLSLEEKIVWRKISKVLFTCKFNSDLRVNSKLFFHKKQVDQS